MANLFLDQGTPGFSLEKLQGNNFWSGRVNEDLRLIMFRDGDANIVVHVGHHNDAYSWAANHDVKVHEATRSLQLIKSERLVEQVVEPGESRLFEQHDDHYLMALGVPPEWLPAVNDATDSNLDVLIDALPEEVALRLLTLNDGKLVPVPRPHVGEPLNHPDTLRHFKTVEVADDLAKALEYPWDQWTVFLHAEQRSLVEASFSGPAKVSGPAGTGKTVVALHRAFRLAQKDPSAKVLLTTFSRTLASRIEQMAQVLAGGADQVPENLTIQHIHSLARQVFCDHTGLQFQAILDPDMRAEIESAMGLRIMGSLTPAFLQAEWKHVIDYWGISDLESYRGHHRAGRGTILGQRQREDLWSIFGAVLQNIADTEGRLTFQQLAFAAARIAQDKPEVQFRHVIVDEIQDFGPAEIALIRSITPVDADDLFLCGDAGQQIYSRPFAWNSLGVQIQGRSRHLLSNYRNTKQIQELADMVMGAPAVGGDGETEDRRAVSLLRGEVPIVKICKDETEEILCLSTWFEDMIKLGYEQNEIAVFSRRSATLSNIAEPALRQVSGLSRRDLQDRRPPSGDGVAFGTMHRAKGLEFKAVAVIGCGKDDIPDIDTLANACDDADKKEIIELERNLLHVALTRPRERLLVTSSNSLCGFLPADLANLPPMQYVVE